MGLSERKEKKFCKVAPFSAMSKNISMCGNCWDFRRQFPATQHPQARDRSGEISRGCFQPEKSHALLWFFHFYPKRKHVVVLSKTLIVLSDVTDKNWRSKRPENDEYSELRSVLDLQMQSTRQT